MKYQDSSRTFLVEIPLDRYQAHPLWAPLIFDPPSAGWRPPGEGIRLTNRCDRGLRLTNRCNRGLAAEMAWLLATTSSLGAIARPALRLGGEWAGWSCRFDPYSGALRTQSEILGVTTERWAGNTLQRRVFQLGPECDESVRCVMGHSNAPVWSTLPVAVSGPTTLMAGARSGFFGEVQVDMLNAYAWALDEAISDTRWRCEAIFDGLGGERPRANTGAILCPQKRTRVVCTFDPSTGQIAKGESVLVSQEQCWSVRPSKDLQVQEGPGGRSGLDAAWVASIAGLACFGGQKRIPYEPAMFSTTRLSLPGGVELRGKPGLLEVHLTAAPGQSRSKTILRRSWIGRSCYASVATVGDTQVEWVEPQYHEHVEFGDVEGI
jgi:hypothetical protein